MPPREAFDAHASASHDFNFDTFQNIPPARHHRNSINTTGASRNSSLQKVWADDYYSSDCEEGISGQYREDDIGIAIGPEVSQPPPATRTAKQFPAKLLPDAKEAQAQPPPQSRIQQRGLTAFIPNFRPTNIRSNSKSPERHKSPSKEKEKEREEAFMPTLTGDRDGIIKVADRSKGGLASWFTGSSAPVAVGIPVMEQESSTSSSFSSRDPSPERQAGKLKKKPTLPTLESSGSTSPDATLPAKSIASGGGGSRFNFFSSPKTPSRISPNTVQLPASLNSDEYLTLDITAALFPNGDPDTFSPASYKNLLMNAEGLLLKLQTAYKLRTLSLHELSAEREALKDELDEATTRAECLRSQVQDLALRGAEKDALIVELGEQLAAEKRARAEEKEAREKSIALIKARAERDSAKRDSTSDLSIDTQVEDLGIANGGERKKWRRSGASVDLSAEGESDNESGGGESVFSRCRSPTLTIGTMATTGTSTGTEFSTPEIGQAAFARVISIPPNSSFAANYGPTSSPSSSSNLGPGGQRPRPLQQKSTFQKLLTGLTSAPAAPASASPRDDNLYGGIGLSDEGCTNCRGKDASVAWDTVGLLRAENRGLKDRVGVLEGAVDGALGLCDGLGMGRV